MNKAFKVIWNHATQSWTAVSEIARAKGKTKSVKTAKTVLAAAITTVAISGTAQAATATVATADTPTTGTTLVDTTTTGAIAIGAGATTTVQLDDKGNPNTAYGSIAIGQGATARGITLGSGAQLPSIAIGQNASAVELGTALGLNAKADNGQQATAIGSNANASADRSIAIGVGASATHQQGTAIGFNATSTQQDAVAVGTNVTTSGSQSVAIGTSSHATGGTSIAIGGATNAAGDAAIAMGCQTKAIEVNSTALGFSAVTAGANATAVGAGARSFGDSAFAASRLARAHGDASNAMGYRAFALGDNSTAVGTNAVASSAGALAMGTDSVSGIPKEELTQLNNLQLQLAGQYMTENNPDKIDALKKQIAAELTRLEALNIVNTVAIGTGSKAVAHEAIAIGNQSVATGEHSSIIGSHSTVSGVNTAALGNNITSTGDNNVVLGNNSSDRLATEETEAHTANLDYTGFKATEPVGVVSFGSPGEERQLVNVAAGNVTSTSTDAINGSQLYAVATVLDNQANHTARILGVDLNKDGTMSTPDYSIIDPATGKSMPATNVTQGFKNVSEAINHPITFKANTLNDTDANGSQHKLGSTISIIGASTAAAGVARDTTAPTAGTYSAKNIQTVVTDNEIQIQMADTPELKGLTIKNGDQDSNPVVISSDPGATGGTISNLTTTLKDPTGLKEGAVPPTVTDATKTNAATLGDVLNAGWNLQVAGQAQDLVSAYDTVNFANGTGTTATYEVVNGVNTVKYNVNVTDAAIVTPIKPNENGSVDPVSQENATKLVNAGDVVNAINNSGWKLAAEGTDGNEVIKPSDVVTFKAGDNMAVKREGANIIYSTAKDVSFDSIKVGNTTTAPAVNLTTEAAIPANNNPVGQEPNTALNITDTAGKPTQITGVGSTLNTTTVITAPEGKDGAPATANLVDLVNATTPNAAATVGDLQNMGWIVGAPGNGYTDAVKNANQVDFVSASDALTVTGKTEGNIRTITLDLDASKLTVPTTNLTNNNGEVQDPTEGDKLVNATTVAGAINDSGWTTEATNATTGAKETVVVNPGDAVNYESGNGTIASTTVVKDPVTGKDTVVVKYDIDNGVITPNADGSVTGPAVDEKAKLAEAEKALAAIKNDATATPAQIAEAQKAVDAAKANVATAENKVATAQNVADAINGSGFRVSVNEGENTTVVNPSEQVDFDNTDGNIAITKTTDEVSHNITVNLAKDITVDSVTAGSMNVTSSLPTDTIVVGGPTIGDNTQPKTTDTLLNVTKAAEETPDAVVTAKDLANYGWIAATPNNGYDAAVKSQNTVNFIGDDGIAVTGKANATTGTYDIVVGLADAGKIVKEYTSDENGAQPTETGRVETAGSNPGGFVSANTVADAINGSGWTTEATNATTGAKETVVVNPGDAVNYADGKGTVANTTVVKDPATGKDTVVVSFDIDNGTITPNANGSVSGPVTPALTEALKAAEEAQKALPADATPEQVAAAEQAVKDAQDAITNAGNQVATAQNVADAINGSGFRVSVNKGENTTVVNPSEQVNFDNTDKNIVISKTTDEVNHNVTVNLAKDITVNSVNITTANPVVDADGNPVLDNAGNPVTENLSTPLTTIKGSSLDVNGETPKPADQNPTTGVGTGNALSVGGNQITHVANGAINADSTDAINGAQLYALEERISQGLVVKTTEGDGDVGANNGPAAGVGGKTLEFEAGKNVVLTQTNTETGTKLNIAVSEDPTFNTTTIAGKDGKNGITLTATNGEGKIGINGKDGTSTTLTTVPGGNYNSAGQKIDDTVVPALSVGGNQITHVANGAISPSSTDAINGSQLYALQSNINNQIGDVNNRIGDLDANRKAGSASAMAAAGLPQAYREGQSGVVAALGQYEGETGIAVGFTSISDNGKWLFRGSYATNSQNENAGNLGIGYYW